MCLVIVQHYLAYTKPISLALQAVRCDLSKACGEAKELLNLLKTKRDCEESMVSLFSKASSIAEELDVDISVPRFSKRQSQRPNAPSNSPLEHYKFNMHNSFVDHHIAEIDNRMCSNGVMTRVKAQCCSLHF